MDETPKFLELSLPCPNVAESLAWYTSLGFAELQTGDMRTHHYAVVTDGEFCIGLHGGHYSSAGISFVRENLARHILDEQLAGAEFEFAYLGDEGLHEATQTDPEGSLAILLEARTFSPGMHDEGHAPLTGRIAWLQLPCMVLEDSRDFWTNYSFVDEEAESAELATLHAPGISLRLQEGVRQPELHFHVADLVSSAKSIVEKDIGIRKGRQGFSLLSPEGTRLFVSQGDSR